MINYYYTQVLLQRVSIIPLLFTPLPCVGTVQEVLKTLLPHKLTACICQRNDLGPKFCSVCLLLSFPLSAALQHKTKWCLVESENQRWENKDWKKEVTTHIHVECLDWNWFRICPLRCHMSCSYGLNERKWTNWNTKTQRQTFSHPQHTAVRKWMQ